MASNVPTPPRRRRRRRPADKAQPQADSQASPSVNRASDHAARREARARRFLISGSALLLLGLGMVGIDTTDVGAGVTLLGLVILIVGIHTFGRLGPEETALPDAANP